MSEQHAGVFEVLIGQMAECCKARGIAIAWIGFVICLLCTGMAVVAVLSGQASVLYTFYPPLISSGWYYGGAFLLIGGSMIWVALMVVNMTAWKSENPDRPVPLAMFAIAGTQLIRKPVLSNVGVHDRDSVRSRFPALVPQPEPRIAGA